MKVRSAQIMIYRKSKYLLFRIGQLDTCERMLGHKQLLPLLVAVFLLTPLGAADPADALLPPEQFAASYDASTQAVNLTWLPPGNNTTTDYVYHVYLNGEPIATTTDTWHQSVIASQYNLYYVRAQLASGPLSPPTEPLLIQQQSSSESEGGGVTRNPLKMFDIPIVSDLIRCGPLGASIEEEFPYLFWGIHWECIPSIEPPMEDPMPDSISGTKFLR
jgi:hypothetical protein